MKGKSLLDFDLKVEPEGKRFTSPDGKLFKTTKASRNLEKSKKRKPKKMRRNTIMHITMDMMMEYKIKNIMKNMILHQVKIAKKVIGMDLLMEVIIEIWL